MFVLEPCPDIMQDVFPMRKRNGAMCDLRQERVEAFAPKINNCRNVLSKTKKMRRRRRRMQG
jgi:hypothetical protein